jgi:two-component system copper resistance phosphate regulon response regulator CusR
VRVLLLDDDADLRTTVASRLRQLGMCVDEAADLAAADERLCVTPYDVAVLDRGLPDGDAAVLLRRLRTTAALTVPVIFLTCHDEVADRVAGFEAGGDDYLGKPFAMAELVARLRSLTRRTAAVAPPVLTLGDLEIDQARARVRRGGRPITLTAKEYGLLEHLVRHAGRVVSRQELLEHCWDEFEDPASNVVEARIGRMRAKLGTPPLVHTVRGTGYLAALEP